MEIVQATIEHIDEFAREFVELMHSTGPVTYDYQFGERALFDAIVDASWRQSGTLFAFDCTRLALDHNELLGIEVGFMGPEFVRRKKALAPLWSPLVDAAKVDEAQLRAIADRSYQCSYLNAAIPSNVHYIHALAVKSERRGQGIGGKLFRHAIEKSEEAGLRGLHLDVLSDNPAVEFYRRLGMDCVVESTAPIPLQHGVPMEMRMAINFGE